MTDNLQTVQAIYAAFGRGDVPAIIAALRDDVEWEHDSVDHGIPWLMPRHGRSDVGGFFEALRPLDVLRFQPIRLLADDDIVIAMIAVELKHRSTGRTIRDLELHLWSFDAAGKVARFRHLADTHQHWLALQNQAALSN